CNCDDPYESNFFKYFALRFNQLGLRKLIATCYDGSPVTGNELPLFTFYDEGAEKRVAYKVEITEVRDLNGDGAVDLSDVRILLQNDRNVLSLLTQHGDFRSPECVALLKEADIVVTNPPFSLFREYLAQLVEYDKKFLIIGNMNALHYKEVFPLIKEGKIWTGFKSFGGGMDMIQSPRGFDPAKTKSYSINGRGQIIKNIMGCIWFTNLDHSKRHEELDLVCRYNPEDYPTYENYDAIEVSKVSDIPCDWDGAMGVPTTFLDRYNPEQFELIGLAEGELGKELGLRPFDRSLKALNKSLRDGQLFYMKNGLPQKPYSRILIRRKR
ncbi:MAG: adenine-specific methyltransferase EcoRI family protein, partial [Bacteroidaceae bacterium]|nr:adenine-specific methyltransferase EcoRI family protein [Bacteroidaceae bacterium]